MSNPRKSRARKLEENFCAYLNASFIDQPLLKWYPTRGQVMVDGKTVLIEPPYGVVVCSKVTPANPGVRNMSDVMMFNGETRIVLITPSDNPAYGPMSTWHDERLAELKDALIARDEQCKLGPITDNEAVFRLHGFTLLSEENMTEKYRYGDIIAIRVGAKG